VTTRTYLSIGEVLSLLRQEFPDVTISKIRFLESQGLVNPERTPSGYRKFYEHDVERLRWVLRQQREHFLPLKVIKGRLEQEVAPGEEGNGRGDGAEADSAGAMQPTPVLVGGPTSSGTPLRSVTGEPAPTHADSARSAPVAGSAHPATGPAGAGRRGPTASSSSPALSGVPTAVTPGAPGDSADAEASSGAVSRTARRGAASPAVVGTEGRHAEMVPTLAGEGITLEELAGACGLDVAAVQQLESYGLVSSRVVGGVAYYSEDALAVARLAAGFARFGVEARHLRLHKHAADREAGFIEQIVLPLLKQRNPDARQRAHDVVAELSRLGQGMREVLLRCTLRDQLGG
jgi:DNA-binding transcriptional MerR regulator